MATLGIRDALVVVGVVVAAVVAGGARSFARIDTRAAGRANLSHLLAGVRLFRRMRVDLLEGVVAQLQPLAVPAGRDVLTQGVDDHGGWYLVEQGRYVVDVQVEKEGVRIIASASTTAQTGVEIEALTATAVAAPTVSTWPRP